MSTTRLVPRSGRTLSALVERLRGGGDDNSASSVLSIEVRGEALREIRLVLAGAQEKREDEAEEIEQLIALGVRIGGRRWALGLVGRLSPEPMGRRQHEVARELTKAVLLTYLCIVDVVLRLLVSGYRFLRRWDRLYPFSWHYWTQQPLSIVPRGWTKKCIKRCCGA